MQKTLQYILGLMVLAWLLGACASDDDGTLSSADAITFDVQVVQPATRAGATGSIDYSVLARSTYGFGVFAYGVSAGDWINKPVTYNGSESDPVGQLEPVHLHSANWTYGTSVNWGAQTISFLAYAPYVATGSGSTGITDVAGTSVSDTKVTYAIAASPDQGVDLLWGVRETTKQPWLSTTKATTGGNVTFTFHHALTAIGFHVQAMIDKTNDTGDFGDKSDVAGVLGTDYKLTIKQLALNGDFYENAKLNLNNLSAGVPNWGDYGTKSNQTLTVGNVFLNAAFKHPDTVTPTSASIAQTIMDGSSTGVTQAAEQQVMIPHATTGAEQCLFVIPNSSAQNYTLTVDWCVSRNNGGVYTAEDHTSVINITDWVLSPETKYYINLVFGLKSIQFSVTATDWTDTPVPFSVTLDTGTSASESLVKGVRKSDMSE